MANIRKAKKLYEKATAHARAGEYARAEAAFVRAADQLPENQDRAQVLGELAELCVSRQNHTKAEKYLRRATALAPGNAYLSYRLGLVLRSRGKLDRAASAFERAIEIGNVPSVVYYNYARIRSFQADDPFVGRLQERLRDARQPGERVELLFALGKVAEDCGEFDQAFEYWQEANSIKRAGFDYDLQAIRNRADALPDFLGGAAIRDKQLGSHDGPTPIFIVGMPRAGSTLCEQILATHSQVTGLGELTYLAGHLARHETQLSTPYPGVVQRLDRDDLLALRERYLDDAASAVETEFFTDKLPANFWLVGLIRMLFPTAPIIDARRDEMDTLVSCYKHLFADKQGFAYDLMEIRGYIDLYKQAMEHWQIALSEPPFEHRYEELIAQPEASIRRLLEYCGLEFEPACMSFHESARAVATASAAQVRAPLHGGGVGRWKHYAHHLEAVLPDNE